MAAVATTRSMVSALGKRGGSFFYMSSKASGGNKSSQSNNQSSSAADVVVAKVKDPPSYIFKKVEGSSLGPGASKTGKYKNPEFFSYHEFSFADMDVVMAKHRLAQPSARRK